MDKIAKKEYNRIYYKNRREYYRLYYRKYYRKNWEKFKEYRESRKDKKREYYLDHKENWNPPYSHERYLKYKDSIDRAKRKYANKNKLLDK